MNLINKTYMYVLQLYAQDQNIPCTNARGTTCIIKNPMGPNNPNYKNGRATSVVAGINALDSRTSAVLILNVDQPRTTALLNATIDNHFEGPGLITIPTYRGQRGHPSIFDASLITELSQILDVNMGLKEVIHRKPSRIHEFHSSSPITILDINRPEEYKDGLDLFKNSEPSNL